MSAVTTPVLKSTALTLFRVAAYVVGVGLLLLALAMVVEYGFADKRPAEIIAPVHGFLYMVYLLAAFNLAAKNKWSIRGTVFVLLAGTVPFVSFIAERRVTRRVLAGIAL